MTDKVATAGSADEALRILLRTLAPHGYRHAQYSFIALHDPGGRRGACYQINALPQPWLYRYEAESLSAGDYVIEHCMRFRRPLPLDEIEAKYLAGELLGKQRRAWELGVAYGGRNGIALPLRDNFALSRGALLLIATAELAPQDYATEWRRNAAEIIAIANAFHTSLHRPWLIPERQRLSPREEECLAGTMHGLRTKQIAHQLGTNAKTVEKQLAQARKRLGARTNVQAAVKAMVLGLIPPRD